MGYFNGFYSGIKNSGITGQVINEQSIPIEVSLKELSEKPLDYLNKQVIVRGVISQSDTGFVTIKDTEDNKFEIKKGDLNLEEGSEYEIHGIVKSESNLYYRYYKIDYYIQPTSVKKSD